MNTEMQIQENKADVRGLAVKIALLAAAVVLAAWLFGQYNAGRSSTQPNSGLMQGSVKVTEIDLNSMLEGFIDEVAVAEGDIVQAGDVLLRIEPDIVEAKVAEAQAAYAQAQAGLAQAQAARAAAEAVLNKARNGAQAEDISKAKASYDYAAKTYERMQQLYAEGAISANDFEGAEAQYLVAKATYEQAEGGARPEDIAAAEAQLQQARAAVSQYEATVAQAQAAINEATTYLNHAVITAPVGGVVTAVNVEKGELISTGMALASMRAEGEAWVEVNVLEDQLAQVEQGGQVSLSFPAYPQRSFLGTVTNVSKNPDFAIKKATNENGSFDLLSYCVKIRLEDMDETLYAGMTALVDFGGGSQAGQQ